MYDGTLSIIIPTYKRPRFLRRAIASALAQTYEDVRVFVYDNASGDETGDVVKEFMERDGRVHYYCHEENMGMISNFNYGLRNVKTEYYCFLSDDDEILPDFARGLIRQLKKYPEIALACGLTLQVQDNKIVDAALMNVESGVYGVCDALFYMVDHMSFPGWPGTIFRSAYTLKLGLLDGSCYPGFDVEYDLRMASSYPIYMDNTPCAIFHHHGSSVTSKGGVGYIYPGYHNIIEKIKAHYDLDEKTKKHVIKRLKQHLVGNIYHQALRNIQHGDFTSAWSCAKLLLSLKGYEYELIGEFLPSIIKILSFRYNYNRMQNNTQKYLSYVNKTKE